MRQIEVMPATLLENFAAAMDREAPEWHPMNWRSMEQGIILNLGAGKKLIPGTIPLDADRGWWGGKNPIPFENGDVDGIYAYHFLEHLDKKDLLALLKECQRVLRPGGLFNIAVPWWASEISHQDLDHKSFFSEQSLGNLFKNQYYDGTMPRDWHFTIRSTMIMGLVQRNMVVMMQLERN